MGVVEKVRAGDIRAVAKLIRDIDDNVPAAIEILKNLYPFTGKAHIVGVTGASGAGKSTLIDQMVFHLRKAGKTVGILAVDPTSPFSGGAILGDRVRMQRHNLDEGVFIRSMATRGSLGGLTKSTKNAVNVLDAMGKDYILIETVGVGQDEVDIVRSAHTTIIILVPGMGDDVQTLKAGILEAGDIFVINKADREGANETVNDIRSMTEMNNERYETAWKPPVLKTQAVFDKGVKEILVEIERHRRHLLSSAENQSHLKYEKARNELSEMIKDKIINEIFAEVIRSDDFKEAIQLIIKGEIDPYTACENIVVKTLRSADK